MITLHKLKITDPGLFVKVMRLSEIDRLSLGDAHEVAYYGAKILANNTAEKNRAIFKDLTNYTKKFHSNMKILKDLELAMVSDTIPDLEPIYDHFIEDSLIIFREVRGRWGFTNEETLRLFTLMLVISSNKLEIFETIEMVANIRSNKYSKDEVISILRDARVQSIMDNTESI